MNNASPEVLSCGPFGLDLNRFGKGGRIHECKCLGHGIVEVPAEDLSQPPLADPLRPALEIAQF